MSICHDVKAKTITLICVTSFDFRTVQQTSTGIDVSFMYWLVIRTRTVLYPIDVLKAMMAVDPINHRHESQSSGHDHITEEKVNISSKNQTILGCVSKLGINWAKLPNNKQVRTRTNGRCKAIVYYDPNAYINISFSVFCFNLAGWP